MYVIYEVKRKKVFVVMIGEHNENESGDGNERFWRMEEHVINISMVYKNLNRLGSMMCIMIEKKMIGSKMH